MRANSKSFYLTLTNSMRKNVSLKKFKIRENSELN